MRKAAKGALVLSMTISIHARSKCCLPSIIKINKIPKTVVFKRFLRTSNIRTTYQKCLFLGIFLESSNHRLRDNSGTYILNKFPGDSYKKLWSVWNFFLHLQVNKLACHGFMDAGGRHEITGSETGVVIIITFPKNSYYYSETLAARVLACVSVFHALILTGWHEEGEVMWAHAVGCITY